MGRRVVPRRLRDPLRTENTPATAPPLPDIVLTGSDDGFSYYDTAMPDGVPVCDFFGQHPVRWQEHCAPFDLREDDRVRSVAVDGV